MNSRYIDIHTHHQNRDSFSLINVFPDEIETIRADRFYSLGLHPWEVQNSNVEKLIHIVNEFASKKNILAIGEIGLDKFRPKTELQKEVFIKQLKIAQEVQKPVIIHCVKAFSELLEILKNEQINVPLIIHRYSGNKTIADQLSKYNCYFSFGHELFNEKSKVKRIFKSLDLTYVFLETDDSELSIKEIYEKASDIKNIKQEDLQSAVYQNFSSVFGNH